MRTSLLLLLLAPGLSIAEQEFPNPETVNRVVADIYSEYQQGINTQAVLTYCGFKELAAKLPPTEEQRADYYLKWMFKPGNDVVGPKDLDQIEKYLMAIQTGIQQGLYTGVGMSSMISDKVSKEAVCVLAVGAAAQLLEQSAEDGND